MGEIEFSEVIGAVRHEGKPIIITVKAFDWDDTFLIEVPNEEPICPYCGSNMRHLYTAIRPDAIFTERWKCKSCRHYDNFIPGDYGEREIEVTLEEWNARAMVRSQRDLLIRRYGNNVPKNIHDYWLKPKVEK